MRILSGKINFPVCLAPMVGLSHLSFRRLLRNYLPDEAKVIWPTEMLSSRKLPLENVGQTPETLRDGDEHYLCPQILGNEEEPIRESVSRLVNWGASAIDINMGCPVQKALRHNYGVALMGDPEYAAEVVKMTVRNSKVPVSVKLRAGLTGDINYVVNFVRGLENAGASWISFHPRSAEQKRRGSADWEQIRILKDSVKLPVIGNGDVQVADDVFNMLDETGCEMVMVGRALTARPWLLWQVGERLGFTPPKGKSGAAPSGEHEEAKEYGISLLLLCDYLEKDFGDSLGLRKLRFYIRTGSVWLDFGHHLFSLSMKAKTIAEAKVLIEDFFKSNLRMVSKTELRQ